MHVYICMYTYAFKYLNSQKKVYIVHDSIQVWIRLPAQPHHVLLPHFAQFCHFCLLWQKRDMSTLLDELQSSPVAPDTPSPTLTDVINGFADVITVDDEPLRCRGFTKAGARCKLTADSVTRLHGRSVQRSYNHYVVHKHLSLIGLLVDQLSGRGISEL